MSKGRKENKAEQLTPTISLDLLINGFKGYRSVCGAILQHRGNFISYLTNSTPDLLSWKAAFPICLYGIAVSFFLYSPIIVKYNLNLDKATYLLENLYNLFLYGTLIHLTAKICRGCASFEKTSAVYLIFVGLSIPASTIFIYPVLFYIPVSDLLLPATPVPNIPIGILLWGIVVMFFLIILFYKMPLKWFAEIHQITRKRLIVGLFFVAVPLMALHNLFFAKYVSKGIHFIGEVVGTFI